VRRLASHLRSRFHSVCTQNGPKMPLRFWFWLQPLWLCALRALCARDVDARPDLSALLFFLTPGPQPPFFSTSRPCPDAGSSLCLPPWTAYGWHAQPHSTFWLLFCWDLVPLVLTPAGASCELHTPQPSAVPSRSCMSHTCTPDRRDEPTVRIGQAGRSICAARF